MDLRESILTTERLFEVLRENGLSYCPALEVHTSKYGVQLSINHTSFEDKGWKFSSYEPEEQAKLTRAGEAERRKIKKVFGPFVAEGEAPYVTLSADYDLNSYPVRVRWQGAFTCVKTSEVEVPVTDETLAARESALKRAQESVDNGNEKIVSFKCVPNF